jgi:serine/threonine protein kinase
MDLFSKSKNYNSNNNIKNNENKNFKDINDSKDSSNNNQSMNLISLSLYEENKSFNNSEFDKSFDNLKQNKSTILPEKFNLIKLNENTFLNKNITDNNNKNNNLQIKQIKKSNVSFTTNSNCEVGADISKSNENILLNSTEKDLILSQNSYNSNDYNKKKKDKDNNSFSYNITKFIGSGSFGSVFLANCIQTNEIVAIKKVFQDKNFKNRELKILKEVNYVNIIKMKSHFFTNGENKDDVYLNIVMEYIPDTLGKVIRYYKKIDSQFPHLLLKIYAYQLLKGLYYLNCKGICHRDLKPQNILLDTSTNILKICDFGSAKLLKKNESNLSYICSRYYRAPELIFNSTSYTYSIDTWSAGCIIAEIVLGYPLFFGNDSTDQLIEIMKILGTPTKEQIKKMNKDFTNFKFPMFKCFSWKEVFKNKKISKEFIDLLNELLNYDPEKRLKPLDALKHSFFDDLREEIYFNSDLNVPKNIFEFSEEQYLYDKENIIENILIPEWYKNKIKYKNNSNKKNKSIYN